MSTSNPVATRPPPTVEAIRQALREVFEMKRQLQALETSVLVNINRSDRIINILGEACTVTGPGQIDRNVMPATPNITPGTPLTSSTNALNPGASPARPIGSSHYSAYPSIVTMDTDINNPCPTTGSVSQIPASLNTQQLLASQPPTMYNSLSAQGQGTPSGGGGAGSLLASPIPPSTLMPRSSSFANQTAQEIQNRLTKNQINNYSVASFNDQLQNAPVIEETAAENHLNLGLRWDLCDYTANVDINKNTSRDFSVVFGDPGNNLSAKGLPAGGRVAGRSGGGGSRFDPNAGPIHIASIFKADELMKNNHKGGTGTGTGGSWYNSVFNVVGGRDSTGVVVAASSTRSSMSSKGESSHRHASVSHYEGGGGGGDVGRGAWTSGNSGDEVVRSISQRSNANARHVRAKRSNTVTEHGDSSVGLRKSNSYAGSAAFGALAQVFMLPRRQTIEKNLEKKVPPHRMEEILPDSPDETDSEASSQYRDVYGSSKSNNPTEPKRKDSLQDRGTISFTGNQQSVLSISSNVQCDPTSANTTGRSTSLHAVGSESVMTGIPPLRPAVGPHRYRSISSGTGRAAFNKNRIDQSGMSLRVEGSMAADMDGKQTAREEAEKVQQVGQQFAAKLRESVQIAGGGEPPTSQSIMSEKAKDSKMYSHTKSMVSSHLPPHDQENLHHLHVKGRRCFCMLNLSTVWWLVLPAYGISEIPILDTSPNRVGLLGLPPKGFHPRSLFCTWWDFFMSLVYVATIWLIPFVVSLHHEKDEALLTCIITIVYVCDTIVSLLTPQFEDRRGYSEASRPFLPAWQFKYAKTHLIVDIIAADVSKVFQKITGMGKAFEYVIPIALMLFIFLHLEGCAIYMVGRLTGFYQWERFPDWSIQEVRNASAIRVYSWSIFQYAAFVGAISSAAVAMNASGRLYQQKMDELMDYMSFKHISKETRSKVVQYYEVKYRGKYFEEQALLADMNDSLRTELAMHNCKQLIEKVPFLRREEGDGRDIIFFGRIATALHQLFFVPGDCVVRQGELGNEMYFVVSGTVGIVVNNTQVTTFGEGAFFGEVALIANIPRTATVRALTSVIVYRLSRDDFNAILMEFDDMRTRIDRIYQERMAKVRREQEEKLLQDQKKLQIPVSENPAAVDVNNNKKPDDDQGDGGGNVGTSVNAAAATPTNPTTSQDESTSMMVETSQIIQDTRGAPGQESSSHDFKFPNLSPPHGHHHSKLALPTPPLPLSPSEPGLNAHGHFLSTTIIIDVDKEPASAGASAAKDTLGVKNIGGPSIRPAASASGLVVKQSTPGTLAAGIASLTPGTGGSFGGLSPLSIVGKGKALLGYDAAKSQPSLGVGGRAGSASMKVFNPNLSGRVIDVIKDVNESQEHDSFETTEMGEETGTRPSQGQTRKES
ncbi:hypothetical protein HDU76_003517 [Blyttiomyces sp. JEL0837]|nr:hypothetical protein HDU76_003517 [Blyttiomyces sp. JEL0837]